MRKYLVSAAIVVLLAVLLSWQYRYHLLWKYYVFRGGASIPVVQVKEMPPSDTRKGWVEHRGACTVFDLPDGIVKQQDISDSTFQLFESDQLGIAFADFNDFGAGGLVGLASRHFAEVSAMTIPRMRLAVYEANASGFSWSMSSVEARQYLFSMTAAPLMDLAIDGHVEWHSDGIADVLIEFRGDRTTIFWQFSHGLCGGSINILPKQAVAENGFARSIGESLRSKKPTVAEAMDEAAP